jgi:hypothetical protein
MERERLARGSTSPTTAANPEGAGRAGLADGVRTVARTCCGFGEGVALTVVLRVRVAESEGEGERDAESVLLKVREVVALPVKLPVTLALSVGLVVAVSLRERGLSVAVTEIVRVGVLDTGMQAEDADTDRYVPFGHGCFVRQ